METLGRLYHDRYGADRGQPAHRLVLTAPGRPAGRRDLALPRRRRPAGRGGHRADGDGVPHALGRVGQHHAPGGRPPAARPSATGHRTTRRGMRRSSPSPDDGRPAALGGDFVSNPLGHPSEISVRPAGVQAPQVRAVSGPPRRVQRGVASPTCARHPTSVRPEQRPRHRLVVARRSSVRFRTRTGQTRVGLTSARRARRPLTNPGESSVERDRASSTASEIATPSGTWSFQTHLPRAEAQDGAVDARHPRQRPAVGVRREQLVDLAPSARRRPRRARPRTGSAAAGRRGPPAGRRAGS